MDYLYTLIILSGLNVILAVSYNLILGYGGLVSVAHPVFAAIGAYSSGLIALHFSVPVVPAILLGTVIAALASVTVSLPSLRISGDYLLIASLAFQLGLLQIINNLEFTGAAGGLSNIPSLLEWSNRGLIFSIVVVAIATGAVIFVQWIVVGDYGRAIVAMRDDEVAFAALGRNPMAIKITLFAVGSGLAGLAGGLYGHYFLFVTPDQFGIFQTAVLLTMVVVGGAGTKWGPVVGGVLLTVLPQAITFLELPSAVMGPLQGLIYTSLVIVFLFSHPQGLAGGFARERRTRRP